MNVSPDLSKVLKLAAGGAYDVLPVSCEILSDFITPIEAVRILKHVSKHCFLLESAQADETWGRYTFLGFDPTMEVSPAPDSGQPPSESSADASPGPAASLHIA